MREVLAPFDGAILSLSDFDDIVFRDELVGSGLGVRPAHDCTTLDVFSPLSGTVIKVLPHAFIVMAGDVGVLVHIGIDTIGLHGDGFTCLIEEGQEVSVGDHCFSVDAVFVREQGLSLDTPLVVLDSPKGTYTTDHSGDPIRTGEVLFSVA